jgi:Domain of unknown function (DUF4347)
MFSASTMDQSTADCCADEAGTFAQELSVSNSASAVQAAAATAIDLDVPLCATEIAFIDPDVSAIDLLLAGLRPEVEAVLLNGVEPAPRQMARVMGPGGIHVIAYGAPGEVRIAAGVLSAETLGCSQIGRGLRANPGLSL